MLQVNINRLRHKLEVDPTRPRYLLTETGVGYLLAVPPDETLLRPFIVTPTV